jgi:hypothetical protein
VTLFMLITTFDSTTLAAAAYDGVGQTLWLEFPSGARYLYSGVPDSIHRELLAASSKGRYFNHNIRGRFPYLRVVNTLPAS